jgi:hypothetical protein
VTFGDGSAIQSATVNSTGTVTFNITGAALAAASQGDVDGTPDDTDALQTFVAVAGATSSLNVTGTGANFMTVGTVGEGDDDLVLTNIDTVNINTTTESIIVAAFEDDEMVPTLNLGAFSGHEVHMDTDGTQDGSVTITGFAAGESGDKILLGEATTVGATDIATVSLVATTGYTMVTNQLTAGDITELVVLTNSQISGALTAVTDAGAVEAAILAAGMITSGANASELYIAADNGTGTGIYRVEVNTGAGAGAIDAASEITAVVLIGTLDVADSSTLVAANFDT